MKFNFPKQLSTDAWFRLFVESSETWYKMYLEESGRKDND